MTVVSIASDQRAIEGAVDDAVELLRLTYADLDLTDGKAARDALIEVITDLVTVYGDAITAQHIDMLLKLREASGLADGWLPKVAKQVSDEEVSGSVRWAVKTLFGESYDEAVTLKKLEHITTRLVLEQGRNTVIESSSDSRSKARGYARVLGPTDNCDFCVMLSSRGFSYKSDKTASAAWHDNCRCTPVPKFENVDVDGYDPDALLVDYKKRIGADE